MGESDRRFREYYSEGEYEGFRKKNEMSSQVSGRVRLIFSDGEEEIEATGDYKEDALSTIFDKIDNRRVQEDSSSMDNK